MKNLTQTYRCVDLSRNIRFIRFQKITTYLMVIGMMIGFYVLPRPKELDNVWFDLLGFLFCIVFSAIGYSEFTPIWKASDCKNHGYKFLEDAWLVQKEHEFYTQCELIDVKTSEYDRLPVNRQKLINKINDEQISSQLTRLAEVERLRQHARIWGNLSNQPLPKRIWMMIAYTYLELVNTSVYGVNL